MREPDVQPEQAFGQHVRWLRHTRHWSQADLAQQMSALGHGWHQTTVAKTESGARPLRLNEADALAGLFEANLTDLLRPPIVGGGPSVAVLREQLEEAQQEAELLQAEADEAARAAQEAAARAGVARRRVLGLRDQLGALGG